MPFQFSLEVVLRYRKSVEERELLSLQALLSRRAALLRELGQIGDTQRQLRAAIPDALQLRAVPAVEIHFCGMQLNALERRCELLRSGLEKLQFEVARQTARYQQERQRREVLESLRRVQYEKYQVQQLRREQAALDEMFLLHRGRR